MASEEASSSTTCKPIRFKEAMRTGTAFYPQIMPIPSLTVASPHPMQMEDQLFNFDTPHISDTNTPITTVNENPSLRPPKARSRLTSTPNASGLSFNPKAMALFDLQDLSPSGAPPNVQPKVQSCLDKNLTVDDLKGVLFPLQKSAPERSIDAGSNQFLTKLEKNKPIVQLQEHTSHNLGASFHDSGFESLGVSAISHESLNFGNSPVKRKAGDDITTVESPMKRLAFETVQNQRTDALDVINFGRRLANFDTSLPGSSFFSDRDDAINDPFGTPPPPIFANMIQFSRTMDAGASSADNNFEFTKPNFIPPRRRSTSKPMLGLPTDTVLDSQSSCHAGESTFDIISHLGKRDLSHVVNKIFSSVRPKDIFRCSHVSSSWAAIFQNNTFLRNKIKALKQQYRDDEDKYGMENVTVSDAITNALLKSPAKRESQKRDLSTGRSTLCNLQRRAKRTPTKVSPIVMPTTPSGKNHYVPAENKFQHNQAVKRTLVFGETLRPCPKCGWTAKIYGDGKYKGMCYRYKCGFTFCTKCKSSYHYPEGCSPPRLSPPLKSDTVKEPKIGTKKSRERLKKRLLM